MSKENKRKQIEKRSIGPVKSKNEVIEQYCPSDEKVELSLGPTESTHEIIFKLESKPKENETKK